MPPHVFFQKLTLNHSFWTIQMSQKNIWSISLQRICEVNIHVGDLPRCYKSFLAERKRIATHSSLEQHVLTASQPSVPYSLDDRTTISNYDSQFGLNCLPTQQSEFPQLILGFITIKKIFCCLEPITNWNLGNHLVLVGVHLLSNKPALSCCCSYML